MELPKILLLYQLQICEHELDLCLGMQPAKTKIFLESPVHASEHGQIWKVFYYSVTINSLMISYNSS